MKVIKKILVGGIWIALFLEGVIAFAIWTRTSIADYDVKVDHYQMETKYCPYCGEKLEQE